MAKDYRKYKKLFILILVLLTPLIFVYINQGYLLGNDESYQIEAGKNLADGNGLTYSVNLFNAGDLPEDLSQYEIDYATKWPPGYSFLVYIILKIGLPLKISLIIINLLLILLGGWSWLKFAGEYIKQTYLLIIFVLYLIISLSIFYESSTDIFVWAIFPLLLSLLYKPYNIKNNLFIGILLGLIILFKYSSWFIVGMAFLFFIYKNKSNLKKYTQLISIFIIPLICLTIIFYLNSLANLGVSSGLDEFTINSAIRKINIDWLLYFTSSTTIDPLRISQIIWKTFNYFDLQYFEYINYTLSVLIFIVFIIIFYTGYKKDKISRNLLHSIITSFIAFIIFFLIISIMRTGNVQFFENTRYYLPLLPLLILGILNYLDNTFKIKNSKLNTTIITLLYTVCLAYMVMLGVKKYRDYKWYNLHEEKVKKTIKKISQENTKKITISKGRLFSWFILEDNYYPYKNLDVLKNAKSTSEDIYVFILVNKRNAEKWNRIANRKSTSKDQTENKFRDFANNHSFKKLKIKDINLFYKKIEKGSVNITRDQKN